MVAISAAVLSKSGKVLVSRQFIPISKTRIEGYLASFPKLISHDNQHTIIDTEQIRYIYQPLENLYVLLITNKQSNIMEDIDTLRLLAKLIPDYCLSVSEEAVMSHVFELIFAFDEVISCNGYKENITIAQIKTYTEMDSHEEKIQKIIQDSKMREAEQMMRKKAEDIEKTKAEMRKLAQLGAVGAAGDAAGKHGRYGSMQGGLGSSTYSVDEEDDRQRERERQEREDKEKQRAKASSPSSAAATNNAAASSTKAKGMQLSKAKKTDDFFAQLNKEEKLPTRQATPATGGTSSSATTETRAPDTVRVIVREKLSLELERDGGVKKCDIKGELKLTIFDPDHSRLILTCDQSVLNLDRSGYKITLHPKVNRTLWNKTGEVALTDQSKGFPVGSESASTIIKWRKTGDENDLPFTINFWPNVENNQTSLNIEYTLHTDKLRSTNSTDPDHVGLQAVTIRIPLGSKSDAPEITHIDGEYKYDVRQHALIWKLPSVDSEKTTGSLECVVNEVDHDVFYPITIDFTSDASMSGIYVKEIKDVEKQTDVEFINDQKLEVEKYTIE